MNVRLNTTYTEKQLTQAIRTSFTYSEVLEKLNLRKSGSSYTHIKKVIKKLNLNTDHFDRYYKNRNTNNCHFVTKEILFEKYLIKNKVVDGVWLRNKLLLFKLKEDVCEECGLVTWRDKPLNKQLHHINEEHTDNRLKNLKLLCSNCHTQKHQKIEIITPKEDIKTCSKCNSTFVNYNNYKQAICNDCLNKQKPKEYLKKNKM